MFVAKRDHMQNLSLCEHQEIYKRKKQVESPIGDIVNIYDDKLLLQKWLIGHMSNLIYS